MCIQLTVEQIIEFHDVLLAESGIGMSGIKDIGHLELICEKPYNEYFGVELYPGLFQKAAILFQGLVVSHCFNDCNKRTAVVSVFTFLYLNGFELNVSQDDLFEVTIQVALRDITVEELTLWLENNCHRI